MNCEESKNLMTISAYGKLTPSEKAQLEAHLRECLRCVRIFEKVGKLSHLFNEKQDIPLPNKEKSWQIISAKALKRKGGWLERFVPRIPVFQFSFALLLLVVGFGAGYFIHSGWQMDGEMAQLRQEVLQIREITAASLLRQESMNQRLREIGMGSLFAQPEEATWGSLLQTLRGADDLYLSLSEQTSPLVEIALAFARHIEQLKLH
jgi:hypothetical protein